MFREWRFPLTPNSHEQCKCENTNARATASARTREHCLPNGKCKHKGVKGDLFTILENHSKCASMLHALYS